MKTISFSGIVILTAIFFSCDKKVDFGQFTEANCPVEISEGLRNSNKFIYGYMKVPEFHGKRNSKSIELAVAVFKCRNDTASREPFILNTGGPGLSNIDNFVPELDGPLGDLLLDKRDVVIIELRGLKYSKPNLFTPELTNLQISLLDKHLPIDEIVKLYTDTIKSIYKRFANEGLNLSAYNYFETANDIVYIMEQLGYDKFAVFGSSAGTIVAQHLLMNHPENLSGVIMNAVVDIDNAMNEMHLSSINMLETIFGECESNEKYAKAFPDLKKRFLAVLDSLNNKPDTIIAKYPGRDEAYTIVLNGDRISAWVFNEMYWNTQLPMSLHKIINGDYSELIESPGPFFPMQDFSNGLSWSMILSEWPEATEEQIPLDSEYKTFVKGTGLLMFVPYFMNELRKVWKVDELYDRKKALATNVPVLMLSGQYDHVCPYGYAQELSKKFDTSYWYVFRGVAHSPIDSGPCGIMLVSQFLDNPDMAPDASCVEELRSEFVVP